MISLEMTRNWKKFLKLNPLIIFAREPAVCGKHLAVCSLILAWLEGCSTKLTIFAWLLKPYFTTTGFHTVLYLLAPFTLSKKSTLHSPEILNKYLCADQTHSGLQTGAGQRSSHSYISCSSHITWKRENCFISAGRILQSLILLPKRGLLVGINILYLQRLFSSPISFPSGLP